MQVKSVSRQYKQLLAAAKEVGAESGATECPGLVSAGAIARRVFRQLDEAKGDQATFAKRSVQELHAKELITQDEADQLTSLVDMGFPEGGGNAELVKKVRKHCQDMADRGNGSLSATIADAIASALSAFEDSGMGGGKTTEALSKWGIVGGAITGALGGAVVGSAAGPVGTAIGAAVGAVVGGIIGAIMSI
jgi:phage tail tape-measure protein